MAPDLLAARRELDPETLQRAFDQLGDVTRRERQPVAVAQRAPTLQPLAGGGLQLGRRTARATEPLPWRRPQQDATHLTAQGPGERSSTGGLGAQRVDLAEGRRFQAQRLDPIANVPVLGRTLG